MPNISLCLIVGNHRTHVYLHSDEGKMFVFDNQGWIRQLNRREFEIVEDTIALHGNGSAECLKLFETRKISFEEKQDCSLEQRPIQASCNYYDYLKGITAPVVAPPRTSGFELLPISEVSPKEILEALEPHLSPRERTIVEGLWDGLSVKRIAESIGITSSGVRRIIYSIRRKCLRCVTSITSDFYA